MQRRPLAEEALTQPVIGAFYVVYNTLGFGFLEHVCVAALVHELMKRGHRVGREVGVNIIYDGLVIAQQRIDLIVDERLIVEVKATYALHPTARRQLFNYLRATNFDVGLILHFGPAPKFHREFCQSKKRSAVSVASGACVAPVRRRGQ